MEERLQVFRNCANVFVRFFLPAIVAGTGRKYIESVRSEDTNEKEITDNNACSFSGTGDAHRM
ncbi:MAG: hypothetical protein KIG94_04935, partial [Acetatifactor sp.]|nr:hypothetical protein [Acetatifactor sp.]